MRPPTLRANHIRATVSQCAMTTESGVGARHRESGREGVAIAQDKRIAGIRAARTCRSNARTCTQNSAAWWVQWRGNGRRRGLAQARNRGWRTWRSGRWWAKLRIHFSRQNSHREHHPALESSATDTPSCCMTGAGRDVLWVKVHQCAGAGKICDHPTRWWCLNRGHPHSSNSNTHNLEAHLVCFFPSKMASVVCAHDSVHQRFRPETPPRPRTGYR